MERLKTSRPISLSIIILLLTLGLLQACNRPSTRLEGTVKIRDSQGRNSPGIPQADLQFIEMSTGDLFRVTTATDGSYSLSLWIGCYWVQVMKKGYEDYSSIPSCIEVNANETNTADFSLRPPAKTTVLLVRHAERYDDDLTESGIERRNRLAQNLWKAGITGIYATETIRTLKTVQGTADMLHLPVIQEDDIAVLADTIKSEHLGDTVLVAGHSGRYIPDLINALEGEYIFSPCSGFVVDEYDNLYVVTIMAYSTYAHVINLQYGAPQEAPELSPVHCSYITTVMLLVAVPEDLAAVNERAGELEHALHKAELASIWIPEKDGLASLMATLLPQAELRTYPPGNPWSLFYDFEGKTSLVIARQIDIPFMLEEMQIDPLPVLDPQEFDNLFIFTGMEKTTVLNLRYGRPGP